MSKKSKRTRSINHKEIIIIGGLHSALKCLKAVFDNDLEEFIIDLDAKREADLQILSEDFSEMNNLLLKIMHQTAAENIDTLVIDSCKKDILDLEESLDSFQKHIDGNLNILKKRDQDLQREVDKLERVWTELPAIINNPYKTLQPSKVKIIQNTHCIENKDVRNFQDFLLQTGGHTGGWGNEEHKLFIRFWQKHYHPEQDNVLKCDQLINDAQHSLYDISPEEILAHASWFLKYKQLKDLQVKAIKEWRRERLVDEYHKNVMGNEPVMKKQFEKTSPEVRDKIDKWKQDIVETRNILEGVKIENIMIKNSTGNSTNRELKKAAIAEWTESKQLKILNEINAEFNKTKKSNNDKKKRQKEKNKNKVSEFRRRDELFTQAKKSAIENKKSAQGKKKQNIVARKIKTARTFQYDAPTEQWRRRIMETNMTDDVFPSKALPEVDSIKKIRIPEWRSGLINR